MGERQVHSHHPQLGGALARPAVKQEQRGAASSGDDLQLTPADGARELVAGQRLVGRFLGGGACREMARRLPVCAGVGLLASGEKARQRPLSLSREEASHSLHLHQVQADAEDHRLALPPPPNQLRRAGGGAWCSCASTRATP